MEQKETKHGYDVIYLAACALHKTVPDWERVRAMDLPAVFQMAKFHGMVSITSSALESLPEEYLSELNKEGFRKWYVAKAESIRKNVLMEAERGKLFAWFRKQGIWHMPMKGILLQDLYPEFGMRQMTDNDILFDVQYREAVRTYFTENGYEVVESEDDSHDVYKKMPVYLFEMHFALFRDSMDPRECAYYKNVRERLREKEAGTYEMRFSAEDMYVYCTAHNAGHFDKAGIGLRALMDTYVYLSACAESLDWGYIENECAKIGISEFEKSVRSMADLLFGERWETITEAQLSEDEQELTAFFIHSGTHGTMEHAVIQKLRKATKEEKNPSFWKKIGYIFRRIWLDPESYRNDLPLFYKYKVLRVFLPVYRLGRALWQRPKLLLMEWKTIWKF